MNVYNLCSPGFIPSNSWIQSHRVSQAVMISEKKSKIHRIISFCSYCVMHTRHWIIQQRWRKRNSNQFKLSSRRRQKEIRLRETFIPFFSSLSFFHLTQLCHAYSEPGSKSRKKGISVSAIHEIQLFCSMFTHSLQEEENWLQSE